MAGSGFSDFQEEVDSYLKRGQVFKPAGEFIERLTLCPRYFGSGKVQGLLPAIEQMVDLVKMKLSTSTNKKSWQCWLKEAANALEAYQVVDREWISENVRSLPARPVPKVQSYEPRAGQRDLRYPPSAMGELEEQDDAMEIITITEEEEASLLMSPPARVNLASPVVSSPRRSPRIAAKQQAPETMEVDSTVAVNLVEDTRELVPGEEISVRETMSPTLPLCVPFCGK